MRVEEIEEVRAQGMCCEWLQRKVSGRWVQVAVVSGSGEGRVWWSRIGVVKVIPGSFRVVAVVDGSSWSGRAAAVVVVCRCRAIKANGGHDQEEEAQGGDAREALVVGFVDVGRPVATAAR
jgi:hypothetical protein